MVIIAASVEKLRLRIETSICVLRTDPFCKTVLWKELVAEVPFAKVSATVIIGDQFGDCFGFSGEWYVAGWHPGCVWIQPGQYRGA